MKAISQSALFQPTVLLAVALMAIIIMMILPMPAWILDLGLSASFALAILMFTITLFIERPLDFSTFPTILLASLMLRLSLNVSSTKLIIGQGHTGTAAAGNVIEGFANFIMGGSILIGLVVFGVLLIVNFIVITKGAARMAEVGARFALDGMPGKQLAIDSDMSAGAINHEEAKSRRETEQNETTFFGSLDGASKFVKGDAIAGLLITLLNLVMGLVIGVAVHNMPFATAFETYAILTVGDGLVSQIPAVIISIASALLLARGGASGSADLALFAQLGRYPLALGTVAVLLFFFALVPGLPFIPFLIGSALTGTAAFWGVRKKQVLEISLTDDAQPKTTPAQDTMGDVLDLDDIHVKFSPDLIAMILDPATGLDARIENMRKHIATQYGVILPEIRLTDEDALASGQYAIDILGVEQATDVLQPNHILALLPDDAQNVPSGTDVAEPVYGAPARWISLDAQESAQLSGVTTVNPAEVLATHLLEVIKKNLSRLMTQKSINRLLEEFTNLSDPIRSEANKRVLTDIIPDQITLSLLQTILKLLLEEQISVRNLSLILEATAEGRQFYSAAEDICEHVRQKLSFQIVAALKRSDNTLPLVQLAPEWDHKFEQYAIEGLQGAQDVALPPDDFNLLTTNIAERITKAAEAGNSPALVTARKWRRFLRTILAAKGISTPVLSYEEIGTHAQPSLIGMVPI
ncbi:MAG: flagellar biosynthesis protein FlhA [Halocynthiibacter sp.]